MPNRQHLLALPCTRLPNYPTAFPHCSAFSVIPVIGGLDLAALPYSCVAQGDFVYLQSDRKHVEALSRRLIEGVTSQISHVVRNGDPKQTYPGCVNMSFAYIEGESLLMALKEIALSSGRYVVT